MKIVYKNINEINPYKNNPRNNENAIEDVAKSIKEYGFKVPVVLDKENTIVTGHTRVKAAERLGMREVPCIIADDLTPEQIKEFRLVDNKVNELAAWDFEKLEKELEGLTDTLKMEDFGFDVNFDNFDLDTFFTPTKAPTPPAKREEPAAPMVEEPMIYTEEEEPVEVFEPIGGEEAEDVEEAQEEGIICPHCGRVIYP